MICARPISKRASRLATALLMAVLPVTPLLATNHAEETSPEFQQYRSAKAAYENQPRNAQAAWQFGRACFDMRRSGATKAQRADIAQEGIAACRNALATETNSAPLRYYLGLNLGALAETRGLSALKLVNQMEQELLTAAALDPRFDYAGADRTLGMLYRDAPTIISVGSRAKARQHLLRAVQLLPNFLDNRFELIHALIKWNERHAARKQLEALEESWTEARSEFSGPAWEPAWRTWEAQLQKLRKELEEPAKLPSPRG